MDILIRTIVDNAPLLAGATVLTIIGSAISIVLAMALAVPTAFARISANPLLRSVSAFYVETIRGTPLLLQLLAWFYGARLLLLYLFNFNADTVLYNLLTALNSNSLFPSAGISNIFFAVVGLSFNYGAYLSEVIRAGIEAVDHGQIEAAQALGLSDFQIARHITLPQALRIMVPPLTNNLITLVQDSSFLAVPGRIRGDPHDTHLVAGHFQRSNPLGPLHDGTGDLFHHLLQPGVHLAASRDAAVEGRRWRELVARDRGAS